MKLKGLRVLVTAGPTREFFDPVRFLSNPSSGKMGYALAEAALKRGAKVTLVTGPVSLQPPACRVVRVVSAEDMYRVTLKEAQNADAIFMTAAVSDYRPSSYSKKKMKKSDKPQTLKLVRTKDILKELGRSKKPGRLLIGFAAETHRLDAYARKKLKEKNLDAIVANLVGKPGSGFESDANSATIVDAAGRRLTLPRMSKTAMARKILNFLFQERKPMRSLLAVVAAVFLASTASATEFVVTKTADTNDGACTVSVCSLRDAVIAANAAAGDDVITLPPGFYLLFHEGANEEAAATGDLDITDSVTINGEDAATTVIHGGGGGAVSSPDRIFDVKGSANLTLNHLTLRNGAPPTDSGGGIAMTGTGNLAIDSCDLIDNVAGVSSSGGAIADVPSGGSPTVVIGNSRIANNEASRVGAGVFVGGAATTVTKTEISGNHTGTNGGGLFVITGNLTISDSTIDGNAADGGGGGIGDVLSSADPSTFTITNTSISNNHAQSGGGLVKNGGTLTLTGVTVEDNQVEGGILSNGGGVDFAGDQLTINGNSILRGNTATNKGGGIAVGSTLGSMPIDIEDTLFEQNDTIAGDGGGLFAENCLSTLKRNTFRDNFAQRGGGAIVTLDSTVDGTDLTFDANGAATIGGGLYADTTAEVSISGAIFSNNLAGVLGAAIDYAASNPLTVENATFFGNNAGALVNTTSTATLTNTTFSGNSALVAGASIFNGGVLTISNSALIAASGANCLGPVTSGGHNLDADGSCGLGLPGDQTVDPQLGPLADNGGPTQTCAPLPGSPAIDAGDNDLCPTTDQRGINRPLDGNVDGTADCDIGAVELTACGDGVVESPEECDDGNNADGDACNADCTLPTSGGATGGTTGGTGGSSGGGATGSVENTSGGCSLVR